MARWIGAVGCLLLVNMASAQLAEHPNLAGHPSEVRASEFSPEPTNGNALLVQEVPVVAQEPACPAPTLLNNGNTRVIVTDPSGNPVSPSGPNATPVYLYHTPPAQEVTAVAPYPVYADAVPPPAAAYEPQPVAAPASLITELYSVADLVVGHSSGPDPNQALMSMLAQQNEELAFTLNAAGAGAAGAQQDVALTELAETIKSAFAHEFAEGNGTITLHRGTFSLIVRQSENVHTQIRDLLLQLRHANDTQIKISIELVEMDEARTPFAFAHNGQSLTDAEVAEFRELAQAGEAERLTFNVTTRNGECTSMPAYGLPGTLTAVASHDRREVRLLLDMLWGMEMGMSQQHNHRVPAGGSLLTIFEVDGSGYVVLLSADIEVQEELEDALFGPEDTTLVPATHTEPAPPSEPVSQTPGTQILTQSMIVEVDGLSEDFFAQLVEKFECVSLSPPESPVPAAVILGSVTGDELVRDLAQEVRVRILSRPQIVSLNGQAGEIQIGSVVPVLEGIKFENDVIVPIARNQEVGTTVRIVPIVAADGCIELQLEAVRTKVLDEEVLYSTPDQTIMSPIVDTVEARATFTVPQGKTLVWSAPPTGGAESDGSTLLIFLTSQVVGDAKRAE